MPAAPSPERRRDPPCHPWVTSQSKASRASAPGSAIKSGQSTSSSAPTAQASPTSLMRSRSCGPWETADCNSMWHRPAEPNEFCIGDHGTLTRSRSSPNPTTGSRLGAGGLSPPHRTPCLGNPVDWPTQHQVRTRSSPVGTPNGPPQHQIRANFAINCWTGSVSTRHPTPAFTPRPNGSVRSTTSERSFGGQHMTRHELKSSSMKSRPSATCWLTPPPKT